MCVTQQWALHIVIKRQLFNIYIFSQFFYLNPQPWYQYSKQMAGMLELYFWFRFCPHCHHRHVIRHRPTNFSELDNKWWSCEVTSISTIGATASQIYLRFQFWWRVAFKNVEIYSHTKFRQDSSIRGWDIIIPGFWKQTAATLKFYFRFHFDVSVVIGMWFSVGVPNFIQIGPSPVELWRHNYFQDGGHSIANILPVSALATYRN